MIVYIDLDDNNYLTGWSSTRSNDDDIEINVYRNHEALQNPEIFKYVDGELIKDEERQRELIVEREENENKPSELEQLRKENDELALALMDLAEITLNIGGED